MKMPGVDAAVVEFARRMSSSTSDGDAAGHGHREVSGGGLVDEVSVSRPSRLHKRKVRGEGRLEDVDLPAKTTSLPSATSVPYPAGGKAGMPAPPHTTTLGEPWGMRSTSSSRSAFGVRIRQPRLRRKKSFCGFGAAAAANRDQNRPPRVVEMQVSPLTRRTAPQCTVQECRTGQTRQASRSCRRPPLRAAWGPRPL